MHSRIFSLLLVFTVMFCLSACGSSSSASSASNVSSVANETATSEASVATFAHDLDGCTFSTTVDVDEFIDDGVFDFYKFAEAFGLEEQSSNLSLFFATSEDPAPSMHVYLESINFDGRYDRMTINLENASFIEVTHTGKFADLVQIDDKHVIPHELIEVMAYALECAQTDQLTAPGAVRTLNLPSVFDVYVEPEDGPAPEATSSNSESATSSQDAASSPANIVLDGHHHKVGNATFETEHDLDAYRKHVKYDDGEEYECYDFEAMCADIWGADNGTVFSNAVGSSFYAPGSSAAGDPDKHVELSGLFGGNVANEVTVAYRVDDSLTWETVVGMYDCPEPEEGYYLAGYGRKYRIHPDLAPLLLYTLEHMEVNPSHSGLSELDLGGNYYWR